MLILLTRRCSMACPHCMTDARPDSEEHLEPALLPKIALFRKAAGSQILMLGGGEPTDHPTFFDLMSRLLKLGQKATILATNGLWLKDPQAVLKMVRLQAESWPVHPLFIQVTAVEGLYMQAAAVKRAFTDNVSRFKDIVLIDRLSVIDLLGRARENRDILPETPHKRKATGCFNLVSAAMGLRSGRAAIRELEGRFMEGGLSGGVCKPSVDWNGTVRIGESPECVAVGNLMTDPPHRILKNLTAARPCGRCGVQGPDLEQLYGGV